MTDCKKNKLFRMLLYSLVAILFNQESLAQNLNTFDFQKAYAEGELANLPDSIILVTDVSEFGNKENYTTLNKIKKNVFGLDFWLMEKGGIVHPATNKCKLKIKLDVNIVYFKLCKKEGKYWVKNAGAGKEEKLLLKKIIALPEVY